MKLCDYSEGTRIRIGERTFIKTSIGSFWKEESTIPGNCVSRPSVSMEHIEMSSGMTHVVLEGE